MSLIESISGIRGTIGDADGLTPQRIVAYSLAYGSWLKEQFKDQEIQVAIGRDSRISGLAVSSLVSSTLNFFGINVIDLGLVTTPTVQIAVLGLQAQGGIVVTASHNPENWNALKFLNSLGEFLSPNNVKEVLDLVGQETNTVTEENFGETTGNNNMLSLHIKRVLAAPLVNRDKIAQKNFRVVIDGINSVGGPALKELLEALGIKDVLLLNGELNGKFNHSPEPLAKNLIQLYETMTRGEFDVGFAVDPDGDRLAIFCEDGSFFGEEYTLVATAKYILEHSDNKVSVSNLSSSRALRDMTKGMGGKYFSAPVGEINVVEKMKEVGAIIGGEGSGGVIYPACHYGRDALIGVALFLSYLAEFSGSCSSLRKKLPNYVMIKEKIQLEGQDLKVIFAKLQQNFPEASIDTQDGLKLDWEKGWVHLRASNTEPVVRIYAEAESEEEVDKLVNLVKNKVNEL